MDEPDVRGGKAADRLLVYVREVVGPSCAGPDEGEAFGTFLARVWDRYDRIVVSFHRVDVASFAFFLKTFKTLSAHCPHDAILEKVQFTSLGERERDYLEHALRYTSPAFEATAGE